MAPKRHCEQRERERDGGRESEYWVTEVIAHPPRVQHIPPPLLGLPGEGAAAAGTITVQISKTILLLKLPRYLQTSNLPLLKGHHLVVRCRASAAGLLGLGDKLV